ncbi:uncharacterized protein LOC135948971 isoform X2 [Calliphora vicina]|uniref:uncharacterized protein LOC135948971 isoform X2 n=1 Tax=Calliphora vicina TaxID=7373 RepID=UPI00325AB943
MCIFAKISPSIKLTARLSCNTNSRRYTSMVQVQHRQPSKENLLRSNLAVNRLYRTNGSDVTSKGFMKAVKKDVLNTASGNSLNSILPIALIDLNPLSNNSSKVLLIPLNWQEADEHSLRNTITSIFSKPKNLQQIEAFSQALKEVPAYQEIKENEAQEPKDSRQVTNTQKEQLDLKDSQLSNNKNVNSISIVDNLEHLASAVEKSLQQCCLHSMQMFVDDNLFWERITGLKFPSTPSKSDFKDGDDFSPLNKVNMTKPFSPSSRLDLDLKAITRNAKMPFPEIQSSSLTDIMFPLSFSKKLYSTRSTAQIKSPTQKVVILTTRGTATNSSSRSKCNPNYDFPYLTKLFDTKELLMSCDAYNQALIEAAKRRAALTECTALSKNLKNDTNSRPQVISIKGCSDPFRETLHKLETTIENSCPPPTKTKKQSREGCKKDDPCKSPECPNPCKDEMEKLKRQSDEEMKKKRNKMPTGCESPKCKKDDSCTKLHKSPCKKATSQQASGRFKCPSKSSADVKQMKDSCKKDDPCKPPECPNPCKEEMEKLKRQTEEDMKRKRNKSPTGCVSPKCKKDDGCTKLKESPCKKASDRGNKCSQEPRDYNESLECSKKDGGNKGKSDSCGKTKDKTQQNPCLDEHTEYKPKCNTDPCKKDGSPCGGAKKTPAGSSANKKADSCGCGKKEDPCKKDKKKEDPCKKKDKDPCGSKKEDPCKKKDPCGGNKQKQDPCKKEDKNPCGNKKEDPCKNRKSSPCGSRKEDPCKKQKDPCKKKNDDPCGGKKDDPCKKKKESTKSPCGNKNEDPCNKDKDDPCKKKKSSPCVSNKKKYDTCKKKPTSPCKPKKDNETKCQKTSSTGSPKKQACGKPKKETKPNCGQNKKCFGTSTDGLIKRTFTSFTTMPSLKNKNCYSFGFMRKYSSKSGGNKKKSEDLGRASQCKSVETIVPPKRKPAYNPHPKDGLRKCYPTYDMDCTKFCKEARKTDCRKYAFLKDTDNNKRKK